MLGQRVGADQLLVSTGTIPVRAKFVLVPASTVVIDDGVVRKHLLHGMAAVHHSGTAGKRGVSQQPADGGEIAVVHTLKADSYQARLTPPEARGVAAAARTGP
jgi:hypothetical protein